jgi:hypothetical protein
VVTVEGPGPSRTVDPDRATGWVLVDGLGTGDGYVAPVTRTLFRSRGVDRESHEGHSTTPSRSSTPTGKPTTTSRRCLPASPTAWQRFSATNPQQALGVLNLGGCSSNAAATSLPQADPTPHCGAMRPPRPCSSAGGRNWPRHQGTDQRLATIRFGADARQRCRGRCSRHPPVPGGRPAAIGTRPPRPEALRRWSGHVTAVEPAAERARHPVDAPPARSPFF